MKAVQGSIGTSASLGLRIGQVIFSSSSLFFMSWGVGFYSYTSFCFLVTVMGLHIPWSFTLALLDAYSIFAKCPLPHSGVLRVVVLGDSILAILTLAAASSTASILDVLLKADVSFCRPILCERYKLSVAMAFLSWIPSLISALTNLWILPTL